MTSYFHCHGAVVKVHCQSFRAEEYETLVQYLSPVWELGPEGEFHWEVEIEATDGGEERLFFLREQAPTPFGPVLPAVLSQLENLLTLCLMKGRPDLVILHAAALSIGGQGLIIPAVSRAGKSTLCLEFCKHPDTVYYSDELALIDENFNLLPYTRRPAARESGRHIASRIELETLQSSVGNEACPLKTVLLTHYEEGQNWNPTRLTPAATISQLVPHLIIPPEKAPLALGRFQAFLVRCDVLEGVRGEAGELVDAFFRT